MPRNTVCLVECDDAIRESLVMLLEQQGMSVACYPSGSAFLKSTNLDCCSCFLFDNELPELSGMELLEILRSRRVGTPAVIMTAGATPQLTHRAARAGAAVLHKPMSRGELMETLRLAAPLTFFPRGESGSRVSQLETPNSVA